MPEVKRWLKHDKMYEKYHDMEMVWIDHHNPDLVLLNDDGSESQRIDLSPLGYQELTNLIEELGFEKK
jgi:hypothetical protein